MRIIFIVIFLLSMALTCYSKPESTIEAKVPNQLYIINGVNVSENLVNIRESLGDTNLKDGLLNSKMLCYSGKNGKLEIFISEMVQGFELTESTSSDSDCLNIEKNLINGIGINLGVSKEEVMAILGSPTSELKELLSYRYEVAVKKESNDLYIDSTVNLIFYNNKLVKMSVFTSSSA